MVKKSSKTKKISNKIQSSSKIEEKSKMQFDFKIIKKILPVIFILFAMWFAFYVRSGPINLSGLDNIVSQNTYSQIHNIISQQVNAKYSNLNQVYKQEMIQKEYQKVLDTGVFSIGNQKIAVTDVIKKNTQSLKDAFKAPNGQTYLNAIDPYYWIRKATNMLKTGTPGNIIINGTSYDTQQLSPVGVNVGKPSFQIWIESEMFKLNGLTANSPIGDKTKAVYLLPVIFSMLAVIPVYFIIRKFSNDLFALFGTLLLMSLGIFVSRTVAGFVDTDAYNVLFPLIIIAFLLYSFTYKNRKLTILFALLAGFFQGFFLWAWGSGWFIFVFIIGALVGYLGYILLKNILMKEEFKKILDNVVNDLFVLGFFILSSVIFTFVFVGQNIFNLVYHGVINSISGIATISHTYIWPNVLSTVAELNPASFSSIISSVGGKIVFVIALIGLLFLSVDFKSSNDKLKKYNIILIITGIIWFLAIVNAGLFSNLMANLSELFLILLFLPIEIGVVLSLFSETSSSKVFLTLILSIWMAGTIYMSLNGVRFILLLGPAFAIAFALGMYYLTKTINNFIVSEFHIKNSILQVAIGFVLISGLFIFLFLPVATQANVISKGTTPNFDDAWYSVMYKIKNESQSSAIITSWWDFGHFFATVSNRGTTFDGATQTTPRAHWVGMLLLENNESISHDILRMLVCGGNSAFNYIDNVTNDNTYGVKTNRLIYQTFGKTKEEKIQILKDYKYYNFTNLQIKQIMNKLACDKPREDFLITSQDMVGKAGVWAHWGLWDFTKKYVYDNYNNYSPSQLAKNLDENVSLIENYVKQLREIDVKSQSQDVNRDDLINKWFADYPSYIPIQNKYEYPCTDKNNTLVCQNGVSIDLRTYKVSSNFNANVKFKNLVYPSRNKNIKVIEQNPNGNVDVVLVPVNGKYNVLLAQSPLGTSLFTKLFYLDGYGSKYFKKFDDVQSATGVRVKVWKVLWNLNQTTTSSIISKAVTKNLNISSIEQNVTKVQNNINLSK